ncbi:energy transducer TonB [Pseudokordiimonas caeni]|uniref:energy transducer TonB n=1 Tax=Pseudokordiimonas caeni TaxID=2997908 RepID=UPI00281272E0|nr:TonB family protein [Pseudokordiimonas caeni]
MNKLIIKGALAAALVSGAFGTNAMATDKAALKGWAGGAAEAVDDVMVYPARAIRDNLSGAAVMRVTINRDGEVVDTGFIKKSRQSVFNAAAKRVAKRADFPAIPASYAGDEMSFALKLEYALVSSYGELRMRERQGTVTGEELADAAPAGARASIQILDTAVGR